MSYMAAMGKLEKTLLPILPHYLYIIIILMGHYWALLLYYCILLYIIIILWGIMGEIGHIIL